LPNGVASFIVKPKNVHFENQKENETILLLLRRHWVTNLPWIIGSVILLFCPLVLNYLPGVSLFPVKYKLVAFIGWYLLIAAFVFTRFLGWFFNVGIVTDKRIVDIDFFGLLYKEITSADLNKIQDVSQQQVGAIRALFDFGDIFVQTASETAKIEFEAVPHPARVIDLIDNLT
jgi:membrane protein YdbS with pleckstrin-like domain